MTSDVGVRMNVKISVLAAIAVVAGLLTGCNGDDGPNALPSSVAAPSGVDLPGGVRPSGVDPTNEPATPGQASPAPPPGGSPAGTTSPAGTAPGNGPGTTPPGSGNGLCLDRNSDLVTSAIAGLDPAPVEDAPWTISEASEDPIAEGCDDLLSYVAVEWIGIHPATHILFFTDGRYLGTGSEEPYAYTTIIDNARVTVSAEYRWPLEDDPLCCPQGGPNLVVYYLSADGELTANGEFPPN